MFQKAHKSVNSNLDENHKHIGIKWMRTGKECIAMGTEFVLAVGEVPVELFAYLVFHGPRCKLVKIALFINLT